MVALKIEQRSNVNTKRHHFWMPWIEHLNCKKITHSVVVDKIKDGGIGVVTQSQSSSENAQWNWQENSISDELTVNLDGRWESSLYYFIRYQ